MGSLDLSISNSPPSSQTAFTLVFPVLVYGPIIQLVTQIRNLGISPNCSLPSPRLQSSYIQSVVPPIIYPLNIPRLHVFISYFCNHHVNTSLKYENVLFSLTYNLQTHLSPQKMK